MTPHPHRTPCWLLGLAYCLASTWAAAAPDQTTQATQMTSSSSNPAPSQANERPRGLHIPLPGNTHRWLLLGPNNQVLRDDLSSLRPYSTGGEHPPLAAASDASGLWGYLDTQGQWALEPQFEDARGFTADGLARVKQNGLWGYLGTDLKLRIRPQWQEVWPFVRGRAAVIATPGALQAIPGADKRPAKQPRRIGVIDTSGALVVPAEYQAIWDHGDEGLARVRTQNGGFNYIDRQGHILLSSDLESGLDFNGFGVAPAKDQNRWGLINTQGQWVLKPALDHIGGFQPPGLAPFSPSIGSFKHGYINTQGQVVIEPAELDDRIGQGLIRAGHPGSTRFSFVDTKGQPAIAGPFDWAGHFGPTGSIPFRRQGEWGLLRADGQWTGVGPEREPVQSKLPDLLNISGGLRTWLHAGEALEWKDDNGHTVYRLTQQLEQQPVGEAAPPASTLQLHAADVTVWTSPKPHASLALTPVFEPRVQDLMARSDEDIVAEAQRMLAAVPRPFAPYSLVFGERRDPYDLESLDDDDREEWVVEGAMTTLAENYVDEELWGEFYFLADQRQQVFKAVVAQACKALQTGFGPPQPQDPDQKYWQGRFKHCSWQVGPKQLMLVEHGESGDGDFETQVSLVVVAK